MKKLNKLFLALIFTFLFGITNVFAVNNLSIESATYDEVNSILTVSGVSNYSEVMVSAFKEDKPIAFKTTTSVNGNYQTTIKVSFAEDTTIIVKVGDINSTEYKMLEVDVKKSLDPVPPKTISDDHGNSLTIVDDLTHFEEHDELIVNINTIPENPSEEEQAIMNFVQNQLGSSKTMAGSLDLRVIRNGEDIQLQKVENGYLLLIKVPKEAVENFKNVYLARLDEEFNIEPGHEFVYDDELGGLVGYVDTLGQFILYEDSAVNYDFIKDTANQTYNKDTDSDITFVIDASYNKYKSIAIGEDVIPAKFTTVKSGSTIITVSKSYMQNLKLGNHTVTVTFNDGKATTNLKVTQNESTPSTIDNLGKYIFIGAISGALIVLIVLLLLKKKNK